MLQHMTSKEVELSANILWGGDFNCYRVGDIFNDHEIINLMVKHDEI